MPKIISVQVATKKDIQLLRNDSKKSEKAIRAEVLKVEERVENLDEGQKKLHNGQIGLEKRLGDKIDNLTNIVLDFISRVKTLEDENALGVEQYGDHEKRISKLEASTHSS